MKKISVLLVIIWMVVIFTFSNTNAINSTKQSDGVISVVAKIFHYDGDITNFRYLVRKTAHFTLYLLLGILVCYSLKFNNVKNMIKLSLLICILYACTDEIHQLFVNGRSGELLDVCIDTLGSLLGVFLSSRK